MDFKKLYVIDTTIHSFESNNIVCRNVFNNALQRHVSSKNVFSYILETEDNFYCIGTSMISRLSIVKTRIFVSSLINHAIEDKDCYLLELN